MMGVFEKGERLRHIGHLDIQRAMQRALRRSGLPVGYSNGFNPHILVAFASALSTGASGKRELMDVTLSTEVTPEAFLAKMNTALPPDLQLSACKVLPDRHPALMAQVAAADYSIRVLDEQTAALFAGKLDGFMGQSQIMATRKTKSGEKECDCKPLIHAISMEGDCLHALLTLTERESCKPDMLIKALSAYAGIEAPRVMVCRNMLLGYDESGALTALENL